MNKTPKKPWYSENYTLLRKKITRIAKLLQNDPKIPYIMGQYQKIKKSYKHMIKVTKQQMEIKNIQELLELTGDPKLFWSHLKSLRGATKSSTSNVILPQKWVEHFSKLLYSEIERKEDQDDADRNIRNTIFDSPFTSEEIVKGIALLKSKKASGYHSISNEMIKPSPPCSLSFLVTLFNKILQSQIYPEEWSRGKIIAVPKSREKENPDNYRSITINSCLSKLFNILLNNRLLY